MLQLEAAVAQILAALPPPASEMVPLDQAQGRVLSEPVRSAIDLPPFDNSSMDGYAVRAEDVAAAGPEKPVRLRLAGRVPAGAAGTVEVTAGTCVRLFTGSALPRGADAVVMQEDTRTDPGSATEVAILDRAAPWENVRLRGEDVKRGDVLAEAGEEITVGRLSLLAATGLARVSVGRRPSVGLLATGSELREANQPLAPGQIYESNRAGLAALTLRAGGIAKVFPLVPDEAAATRRALTEAFEHCDAVVTSGGVSVGEFDLVKGVFQELGGELEFWRVAIRPGRPFVFGRWGRKFLFGLPGNPVSALVTFLLLVRPALRRWQGASDLSLPARPGVLAEPLTNRGERRHFVRVRLARDGQVFSAGLQASHALS
ncbi:MAG: gephyrin-like molybdotransferase Glp, partial [Opitutales bacterium]